VFEDDEDDLEMIVTMYRVGVGLKEIIGEYHARRINESEEYICTYIEWEGFSGKYMEASCSEHMDISSFDGSYVEFPYGLIISDDSIENYMV
jgi:hypothetical protein